MKKPMFAVIAMAALTLTAIAAPRRPVAKPAAPAEPEPPDGGMVLGNAEGKLAIVNACGYEGDVIANSVKKIGNVFMIVAEEQTGSWSLDKATEAFDATKANAAVFVVKDKTLPISLVALESRWGLVNAEGMNDAVLGKEIMRISTLLLGGASSKYEASVMRPAFSLEDIEKLGELATIDSLMAIFPNLQKYGFKQFEMMTFREAYESGYKPEPKNDEQKAIAAEFMR